MLERLSTNSISSQLRTPNLEEVNHNIQEKHVKKLEQNEDASLEKKEQAPNGEHPVSKEKIQEMVEGLNQFLQPAHTAIHFEYHEKLDKYYVKVIDQQTDEIIREIPSKKLLDVYASMLDFVGIMVDKKI